MSEWQQFEEVCQAMADPAFYPHPVSSVERRETHISVVFLTGDWVYKLKKPVEFGFLDFRTLSARSHFCRREWLLNQRLSHGIYQGVEEIRRTSSGKLALEGPGEVVETAVKMVQLADSANLKTRLRKHAVSDAELRLLGSHLAAFYARAERSPEIDHYGDPEVIGYNVEENFRQIEPFLAGRVGQNETRRAMVLDPEKCALVRAVSHSFLARWSALFGRRIAMGRIRDGHGDLRTDHIYFHQGIQIIDCIEFNERFRYGDVSVDLAFLYMDMDHLGRADLAGLLLRAYADAAEDSEVYILLDFYAAYRAMVMVKVHCLRYSELGSETPLTAKLIREAKRYLHQAYRYALQFSRPTLWIFCGMPATGKSTLAGQVAQSLSLPLFQSDLVRKQLFGLRPGEKRVVPFGAGIYRKEMAARVYGNLLALAQEQLKKGHSMILDATFSRQKWRQEARQLAADLDVDILFVECCCAVETIQRRLENREQQTAVSDARAQHLPDFLAHFEPLEELHPEHHLRINTDAPPEMVFAAVLAGGYAAKRAQVRKLL